MKSFVTSLTAALDSHHFQWLPGEIADCIWLAACLGTPDVNNTVASTHQSAGETDQNIDSHSNPSVNNGTANDRDINTDHDHLCGSDDSEPLFGQRNQTGRFPAKSVTVFGAPGVSDQLGLDRALKSLRSRRINRRRQSIDEAASLHALIETGIPTIVRQPTRSRNWLHFDLVVERSPTMRLWQHTAEALKEILGRAAGAGIVNVLYLEHHQSQAVLTNQAFRQVSIRAFRSNSPVKCVLVLSDATGFGWQTGQIPRLLSEWARQLPVIVVQPLPIQMWNGTSLRFATLEPVRSIGRQPLLGTLTPEHFQSMAELLTYRLPNRNNLMEIVNPPESFQVITPELIHRLSVHPPDEQRQRLLYQSFAKECHPLTFRLALYLASLPMTLPIMRLAQAAFAQEASPWLLADLFSWGLIRRKDTRSSGDREPVTLKELDAIQYEFWPIIGDLLRADAGIDRFFAAQRLVSRYVNDRTGKGHEFMAYILGRQVSPDRIQDWTDETRAFAHLSKSLLASMGITSEITTADRKVFSSSAVTSQQEVSTSLDEPDSPPPSPPQKVMPLVASQVKIAPSRLPPPNSFTGREHELKELDAAWTLREDTPLYAITGAGGIGKSSLVSHWVSERFASKGWPGVDCYFDWSFYEQAPYDLATSDQFFHEALQFFGDPDPNAGSPFDRSERLLAFLRKNRTLLILDGLERMQASSDRANDGEIIDAGLAWLIDGLAEENAGLCVVTSRADIVSRRISVKKERLSQLQTVYLSSVSREFLELRVQQSQALQQIGIETAYQGMIVPSSSSILIQVAETIQSCNIVIHVVGALSGASPSIAGVQNLLASHPNIKAWIPPQRGTQLEDISYAQWEAYLALYFGKALLVYVSPRHQHSDVPHSEEESQSAHLAGLQHFGVYPKSCDDVNSMISTMLIDIQRVMSRAKPNALHSQLDALSAEDAIALLKKLGVRGNQDELTEAYRLARGHALTLNLLAKQVVRGYDGDVSRWLKSQSPSADATESGKPQIVFVDDDQLIAAHYINELSALAEVVKYESAELAKQYILNERNRVALLITDDVMPSPEGAEEETQGGFGTGLWLIKQIQTQIIKRDLPVILLSQREPKYLQSELRSLRISEELVHVRRKLDAPPSELREFAHMLIEDARRRRSSPWRPRVFRHVRGRSITESEELELACRIVSEGIAASLGQYEHVIAGRHFAVGTNETKSLTYLHHLISRYTSSSTAVTKKPLSLAVFGPPGSGKSWLMKDLISSSSSIEPRFFNFNVAQFVSTGDLSSAWRTLDDHNERLLRVVLFDEFDCSLENTGLGWLRYFLAPMEDGSFSIGSELARFDRMIMVFTSGMFPTYGAFSSLSVDAHHTKLPDFVSRLNAYINCPDVNPAPSNSSLSVVRRAIVFRLVWEAELDLQPTAPLMLDEVFLRELLQVPSYRHGARSIKFMAQTLSDRVHQRVDPGQLPPALHLHMHIDSNAAERLTSIFKRSSRYAFISYSRQDTAAANKLKRTLQAQGFDLWMDSSLTHGDNWRERLSKQIHESELFIAVISKNSEASPNAGIREERQFAAERLQSIPAESKNDFYIPVVIDDVPFEEIRSEPSVFENCHRIRLPGGEVTAEFTKYITDLRDRTAAHG